MSLVQSIFGDIASSSGGNVGTSTLFDQSKINPPKKTDGVDDSSSSSSSSNSDSGDNANDEKEGQPIAESPPTSNKNTPAATVRKTNNIKIINPQDEEERTVFVGNLPLSATRKTLTKLFAACGKIQSTRLRSVAIAGVKVPQNRAGDQNLVKKVCTNTKQLDVDAKSSLQGYVVFCEKESVLKAIEQLNNKPLQDDHPSATRAVRRIRVDRATPTLDPKRSVFVGNLPYHADEATLQECFVQGCALSSVNDVVGVRIIRDSETHQCKGFGYVLFQDSTMVATALQKMDQVEYMKRPLRVKVCGKSIKGRRGEPKHNDRKRSLTDQSSSYNQGGGSSHKKQRTSTDGSPTAAVAASAAPQGGAMKRLVRKEKKNKRRRGEKKKRIPGSSTAAAAAAGKSKRAASEAKTDKRVKKLQKRISRGMGKARK